MSRRLPPGPSYPSLVQAIGFWKRPLAFLESCRARYGGRFVIRLPFAPPFVFLTDPDEIKQIYTAPADVLHPGEGARVLEPVVGANSVILLDGGPPPRAAQADAAGVPRRANRAAHRPGRARSPSARSRAGRPSPSSRLRRECRS